MMSVVPVLMAVFAIAAAQQGQFQFPYPFAFQQPAFTQQSAFSSFPAFPQAHAAFPQAQAAFPQAQAAFPHAQPAPAAAAASAPLTPQQAQAQLARQYNPAAEQQLAQTIVQHYHNDHAAQLSQLAQLEQIKASAGVVG